MATRSYQAAYDVLSIVTRLENVMGGITPAEIHLLSYVACLLALYRRRPVAEWGYTFIRSQWGAPFSQEISGACIMLTRGGFLTDQGDVIRANAPGRDFVEFLDKTSEHQWRTQYLDGACSSALAIPVGSIRSALHQEPSLKRANVHQQPRTLLDGAEDAALYQQFSALTEVVGGDVADLMVPSVVWLSYLGEVQKLEMMNAAAWAGQHQESDD